MRTFKAGNTIWHGVRYWKTENLESGEVLGWNTRYVPYGVSRVTAKRIEVYSTATDQAFWLNRQAMERDGKQYHSRVHEYFYSVKPPPEKQTRSWSWSWRTPSFQDVFGRAECLSTLGLSQPFSTSDVRRAYKRLAKKAHPDTGGSHQEFIKLKEAHDSALRFAV
jgi:hypothetical protein